MNTVETLRPEGDPNNGPMERPIAPLRRPARAGASPDEHRATLHPHRLAPAQVYKATSTLIFSNLFEPLDEGHTAGTNVLPAAWEGTDIDEDPEETYLLAAALLGAGRRAQTIVALSRLEAATAHRPDQRQWKGRAEFLWAVHAARTADARATLEHCHAASQLLGWTPQPTLGSQQGHGRHDFPRTVDAVVSAQLPLLAARAHIRLGNTDQAQAILEDRFGTQDRAEASQPATLSMLACRQGRLRDALRLATAALQTGEEQNGACELVDIDARLVRAEMLFEQNQLDAAEEELTAALHFCCLVGATHWLRAVEADLIRVMIAQQRTTEALHRVEHLRKVERPGLWVYLAPQNLNQLETECRLALGDLEGARRTAGYGSSSDISGETLARIDLKSGRPDQVVTRVRAGGSPTPAAQIRRLVLLACAEMQQGRAQRAHDTVRRAVVAAAPERYVRPFLEEASQTLPLLRGLLASAPDPYLAQLVREADRIVPAATIERAAVMFEPLTERERQILRYLPSHLNQHQIAAAMCVSSNTVKTHVKAIYRKTGVTSRHDAVTIARSYGLLEAVVVTGT